MIEQTSKSQDKKNYRPTEIFITKTNIIKTQRTFWLATIIVVGFVIAGLYSCSDDEDEVLPDDDTP